MAVVTTQSERFPYRLMTKQIDLDNDTVKVLLMRSGFAFDKTKHRKLINIKTVNAAVQIDVDEPTSKFTRASGSFITDGFVIGNEITGANFANGGNNAVFEIATVSALEITVVDNTGMVTETGSGDETLTSDDELATGNGYTQDSKTTGTITVTEGANTDASFPTVEWTASGGSIGPTPGAMFYDDTDSEDTIIQFSAFSSEETTTDGNKLQLTNGIFRGVPN